MKKLFLLGLLALASLSASAQHLWKISGNGADSPSYLFGTHHIAPISLIDSIPGLADAICASQAVIGEIDMAALSDPAQAQAAVMKFGMAPADSTLTRVLTPAQVDSLDAVLAKYSAGQLNAQMLDALKPSMVGTQLSLFQSMLAFPGYDQTQQLDTEVQNRAKACGREILGFETVDEQMALLFGSDIKEQVADLMEAVRTDGESADKARKLADAYLKGDLSAIEDLLKQDDPRGEEALDKLLTRRNHNWMNKLTELLPAKPLFICVGIGHFVGPDGLIALLRSAGYDVTPVQQ